MDHWGQLEFDHYQGRRLQLKNVVPSSHSWGLINVWVIWSVSRVCWLGPAVSVLQLLLTHRLSNRKLYIFLYPDLADLGCPLASARYVTWWEIASVGLLRS